MARRCDSERGGQLTRRTALRAGLAAGAGAGVALGGTGLGGADEVAVSACGPGDSSGAPRPGPSVLYEEPVTAPQFENGPGWVADPLLVSGATAYDDGEFLYQDWVYDDYGANVDETDTDPQPPTATTLTKPVGDIVYPTDDSRYRDNAADILEFRCRPTDGGVAYRVTLTTLVEADAPIVAIGVDTGRGPKRTDWGHGLGEVGAPVTHVITIAGGTATIDGSGSVTDVAVDTTRNQLEVTVDLSPDGQTWTHYCVTGVNDGEGGFAPVQDEADDENPGGARGMNPPPIFNVAFRTEPIVDDSTFTLGYAWRDKAQADALAARDISPFGARVDFGRLESGAVTRDRHAPENLDGYVNLLFSSRVSIDGQTSYDADEEGVEDDGDDAVLTGRIQPYSVWIPDAYDPSTPGPLHVLPHSLGQSYNQYTGTENQLRELGERRDALIIMFEGRGPAGWWHDEAEYDLFEAWADFRNRFVYDEDRVTLGGYSMGGYATYRLASLYPDLFARGFETVGPPDEDIFGGPTDETVESEHNTIDLTDNMRHVPLLMWHGTNDELVPLPGPVNYAQDLREHGYRHELNVFPGYDHFLFFYRDQWGPGRDFLEGATVTRSPARVTYRSKPAMGNDTFGLTYDGAYWIGDIEVADGQGDDGGLVDAISYGSGYAPPVAEHASGIGTAPAPHLVRETTWAEPLTPERQENRLELDLTGVTGLTVWVRAANLSLSRSLALAVDTDVATTVRLVDETATRTVSVPAGSHEVVVDPCRRRGAATPGPRQPETNGTVPPGLDDGGPAPGADGSI